MAARLPLVLQERFDCVDVLADSAFEVGERRLQLLQVVLPLVYFHRNQMLIGMRHQYQQIYLELIR